MGKYLKAALLVKKGGVPVTLSGIAAFAALGFVHPAFWVLGAVIIAVFTAGLANNERFQKVIDGVTLTKTTQQNVDDIDEHRGNIIRKLPKEEHRQFKQFKYTCDKINKIYEEKSADDIVIADTKLTLDRMSWNYIKLLLARGRLNSKDWQAEKAFDEVNQQIKALETELQSSEELAEAVRNAKLSTLETLKKRIAILNRRDDSLEEIEAGLTKLDSQLQLALDRAGTQGTDAAIQSDYETGTMLYEDLFGEDHREITTTDQLYAQIMETE